MATHQWTAVIKIKVPTGGQSASRDAAGHWVYKTVTSEQIVRITVPDAGGFFSTKAGLENVYGQGSVLGLSQ